MNDFPVYKIKLIKGDNVIDMYLPFGALTDNFVIPMLATGVQVLIVGRDLINSKDFAL